MPIADLHTGLQMLDSLSAAPPGGKPNLLGYSLAELTQFMQESGQPRFRAEQLFRATFIQRCADFDSITTLPKSLRAEFATMFELSRPTIDRLEVSEDGTRKYRFVGIDGLVFEAVYIPEVATGSRTNTLCVSSQTGCAVGCKFCYTASLRRNRNLAAAEIVGQVMAVQDDVQSLGDDARVSNIVYMGMGEPLLNYPQVVRSANILLDDQGLNFSNRRITISTSGIVPRIYDLGKDLNTQLAISLNATTDAVRNQIMPINKKWPLEELIKAMRAYPLSPRRRITVEYVMLKGINDTPQDAHRLVKLLKDIPVKLNLLPLNEHDRTDYESPSWDSVEAFQAIVRQSSIITIVRRPRGQDIAAACGQLGETVVPLPVSA